MLFVSTWLPLGKAGSVDPWSGRVEGSDTLPSWALFWLRFLVGLPYFFGGVAKITSDWLQGFPMSDWLGEQSGLPVVGDLLQTAPALSLFVWGGLLFELLIVPVLLWPRARVVGLGLVMSFHLMNSRLFTIGVFPWMMILVTLVFLPPDWPRRVWADIRGGKFPAWALAVGAVAGWIIGATLPVQASSMNSLIAAIGMGIFAWEIASYGWDHDRQVEVPPDTAPVGRHAFAWGCALVALQVLVPLRHNLVPGDVDWTEEGHRWSWHMKLRDKDVREFRYFVVPAEGPPFLVDPRKHLRKHQFRKVAFHPEMTVRLAHHLVEAYDVPGAKVYVRSKISLNGRAGQPLIDPKQDLTRITVPWWPPAPWILPLTEPLANTVAR